MILPPIRHTCPQTASGAAACPACTAIRETLRRLEEAACTCPAGARRGGLASHLFGCPSEVADVLRIRLAGHGANVPDCNGRSRLDTAPATTTAPPPVAPTDLRAAAQRVVAARDALKASSRACKTAYQKADDNDPASVLRYAEAVRADCAVRSEMFEAIEAIRSALAAPLPAADPLRERLASLESTARRVLREASRYEMPPGLEAVPVEHLRALRSLLSSTGKEESDGRP